MTRSVADRQRIIDYSVVITPLELIYEMHERVAQKCNQRRVHDD